MAHPTRRKTVRLLPLGFILLLMVGCALGPGYGAAPDMGSARGLPSQESSQMQRENGTRGKKLRPSGQKPKDDLSLPPTPTKPPAIGGSGG